MADTIVTNTPGTSDNSTAGWVVALIILVAVIVGGIYIYRNDMVASTTPAATTGTTGTPATTNINVTVPSVPNPVTTASTTH